MNVNQLPAVIKQQIPNARLPVQYEAACKALAECVTLDEAKTWSDKAEALAAWAKIYKSDRAAVEAKRLKLRAYRRMGELAAELRPSGLHKGRGGGRGWRAGAHSLLKEHGLTVKQAVEARALARVQEAEFERAVTSARPPSLSIFARGSRCKGTAAWTILGGPGFNLVSFRAFCRNHPAASLARGLTPDEAVKARELVREIADWLDEFEQYLPKPPKARSK